MKIGILVLVIASLSIARPVPAVAQGGCGRDIDPMALAALQMQLVLTVIDFAVDI